MTWRRNSSEPGSPARAWLAHEPAAASRQIAETWISRMRVLLSGVGDAPKLMRGGDPPLRKKNPATRKRLVVLDQGLRCTMPAGDWNPGLRHGSSTCES